MLTSACSGWIRYADWMLGHPTIPYLCTDKSPNQIMGSLVKDNVARQQHLSLDKILHVVMSPCSSCSPCYDKKLEALQEGLSTILNGDSSTVC